MTNNQNQNTPESVNDAHKQSDVDTGATAQHHTLGYTSVQAAPGDHSHTGGQSPVLTGYATTVHNHQEGDVTSLIADLASKSPAVHSHTESNVTNLVTDLAAKYSATNPQPASAPASHVHVESDTTNLVTDLAGKSPTVHTHTESNVTNLVTDLASKSAVGHTHVEADTTNLVTDLGHTVKDNAPINVTGAKGGNLALASLLAALVTKGIITDATTA
jgi:hypothetical protein